MRVRATGITVALVLGAVLAVGIAGTTAASSPTKLTCTATLYDQAPAMATSGIDFGFASCPKPFGSGVQEDHFTDKLGAASSITVSGPYKEFYNNGTIHGTYTLTGKTTGTTLTGSASVIGGTGAFSHAAGAARLTCTGSATSNKTVCAAKFTLTSI